MFESRHKPVFSEEDVVNIFPVVKHLKLTGTDATSLVQRAQVAVKQGERHGHRYKPTRTLKMHKIQHTYLYLG